MVLDLEINGTTRTERCIRSQNNDGPRFRRDKGQQRTLTHWIDDIHAQQTISMDFSKYRRSHTIIFFIILMNEKGVSISVYLENKTTIIRLSPCVHITFWTVTFRFLWMLTSYIIGGCCHISVVSGCYGSPLMSLFLEIFIGENGSHAPTEWRPFSSINDHLAVCTQYLFGSRI